MPVVRERLAIVAAAARCSAGSAASSGSRSSIRAAPPTCAPRSTAAASTGNASPRINLGSATIGRDGVLVDTFNAPGGRARPRPRARPAVAVRRSVHARRAVLAHRHAVRRGARSADRHRRAGSAEQGVPAALSARARRAIGSSTTTRPGDCSRETDVRAGNDGDARQTIIGNRESTGASHAYSGRRRLRRRTRHHRSDAARRRLRATSAPRRRRPRPIAILGIGAPANGRAARRSISCCSTS